MVDYMLTIFIGDTLNKLSINFLNAN